MAARLSTRESLDAEAEAYRKAHAELDSEDGLDGQKLAITRVGDGVGAHTSLASRVAASAAAKRLADEEAKKAADAQDQLRASGGQR